MTQHSFQKIVSSVFAAGLVAFGVQISFSEIDIQAAAERLGTANPVALLFYSLKTTSAGTFPVSLLLMAIITLLFLGYLQKPREERRSFLTLLLSLFFAAVTSAGRLIDAVLASGNSGFQMDYLLVARVLLFSACVFSIYYPALLLVEQAIVKLLQRSPHDECPVNSKRFTHLLFEKRPFLAPFLLIVLCWLPYLVFCFPGTTDPYDNLDQLQQFHGIASRTVAWINPVDPAILINNNNPVFHTVLLNLFIDFGGLIGSQNLGLFLFVLLQTAVLSSGFAATLWLGRRFALPLWLRKILLLGFCFVPIFPAWTVCVTKDVLFSGLVLWYTLLLIGGIREPEIFLKRKWLLALFFFVALLTALVRNNGIFLVALSVPFLLLIRRSPASRVIALVGTASVVCYFAYSILLLPALHVSPGSIKETLSLPFQQTAYYFASHPDDVTPEEYEAINRILPVSELARIYDPEKADGVKDSFNKDASGEDLKDYFKAWVSMGVRHPGTYAAATAAGCYSYFYPGSNPGWVWMHLNRYGSGDTESLEQSYRDSGFDLEQIQGFHTFRTMLREFYEGFKGTPFGLAANIGFNTWVLLFMVTMLLKRRRYKEMIAFLPLLVLLLICIASPMNGNIRYALPLIFTLPLLVFFACEAVREGSTTLVRTQPDLTGAKALPRAQGRFSWASRLFKKGSL
jgi:hypothetical protein